MSYDEARLLKMKPILDRIPEQWGKYLPEAGWDDLLLDLDRKVAEWDPDYKILQAKEKFGTLRFYAAFSESADKGTRAIAQAFIDLAEEQSARICEACGASPAEARDGGWIKTLCESCAEERGKKSVSKEEEELLDAVAMIVRAGLNAGSNDAEHEALTELADMVGLEYDEDRDQYVWSSRRVGKHASNSD